MGSTKRASVLAARSAPEGRGAVGDESIPPSSPTSQAFDESSSRDLRPRFSLRGLADLKEHKVSDPSFLAAKALNRLLESAIDLSPR